MLLCLAGLLISMAILSISAVLVLAIEEDHARPFIDSKEVIKNSEFSFENGILLPIFNKLTTSQIKFITEVILKEV